MKTAQENRTSTIRKPSIQSQVRYCKNGPPNTSIAVLGIPNVIQLHDNIKPNQKYHPPVLLSLSLQYAEKCRRCHHTQHYICHIYRAETSRRFRFKMLENKVMSGNSVQQPPQRQEANEKTDTPTPSRQITSAVFPAGHEHAEFAFDAVSQTHGGVVLQHFDTVLKDV